MVVPRHFSWRPSAVLATLVIYVTYYFKLSEGFFGVFAGDQVRYLPPSLFYATYYFILSGSFRTFCLAAKCGTRHPPYFTLQIILRYVVVFRRFSWRPSAALVALQISRCVLFYFKCKSLGVLAGGQVR